MRETGTAKARRSAVDDSAHVSALNLRVCKKCGYQKLLISLCDVIEKPGTCPAAYKLAKLSCHHQCETDWDCEGAKKCCGQFCSRVCLEPEGM